MKYVNIKTVIVSFFALVFAVGFGLGAEADTVNCTVLSGSLYMGRSDYTTGGDVTRLQTFLAQQGYFTYTGPKGYFGQITFNSVVNFQRARGISPIGIVGPLTRAEIQRVSCGSTSYGVHVNYLSPVSGQVGTSVTVYGSGFTSDNTIYFGGGVVQHIASSNGTSLTFSVPDSLNPSCYYSNPRCLMVSRQVTPGNYDVDVQNANGTSNVVTFTVTSNPVSGFRADYLAPNSGVVGTSVTIYGAGFTDNNLILFGNAAAGRVSSTNGGTQISFTVPNALNPVCFYTNPQCMTFAAAPRTVPGNYDVSVRNANGDTNKINFTVTEDNNNSVNISGIDAPSQLKVGQSGTWAVHATDGSGSNLSYSVVWGDEANNYPYMMSASSGSVGQTSTFTHTYNSTGTYSPRFTVTNNSGAYANVSSSVNVTN